MHVGVDEAGDDVASTRIDNLAAVVLAEAGDPAVHDGYVHLQPLAGEDREHATAANDHVGGFVAAGDSEASGEIGGHPRGDSHTAAKYAWRPWTCSRPATSRRRCA